MPRCGHRSSSAPTWPLAARNSTIGSPYSVRARGFLPTSCDQHATYQALRTCGGRGAFTSKPPSDGRANPIPRRGGIGPVRVIVTGGAGFIGSNVARALVARGDDVTVLDVFDDAYDPARKE